MARGHAAVHQSLMATFLNNAVVARAIAMHAGQLTAEARLCYQASLVF